MGSDDEVIECHVLRVLRSGDRAARFVTEIARELRLQQTGIDVEKLQQILPRMEDDGLIILREHYCADPHLEGVDLRIVGLVRPQASGTDSRSVCIQDIESVWTDWITTYLAEHRCS